MRKYICYLVVGVFIGFIEWCINKDADVVQEIMNAFCLIALYRTCVKDK